MANWNGTDARSARESSHDLAQEAVETIDRVAREARESQIRMRISDATKRRRAGR